MDSIDFAGRYRNGGFVQSNVNQTSSGLSDNKGNQSVIDLSPQLATEGVWSINAGTVRLYPAHVVGGRGNSLAPAVIQLPSAAEIVRYMDANRLLPSENLQVNGAPTSLLVPKPTTGAAFSSTPPAYLTSFDFVLSTTAVTQIQFISGQGNFYWSQSGYQDATNVAGSFVLRAFVVSTSPAQITWLSVGATTW